MATSPPNRVHRPLSRCSRVRRATSSSIARRTRRQQVLLSNRRRTAFSRLSIASSRFPPLSTGLQSGDRIVGVNGRKNGGVLVVVSDQPQAIERATTLAHEHNAIIESSADEGAKRVKIIVEDPAAFGPLRNKIMGDLFLARPFESDVFNDMINTWPREAQSLTLEIERDGAKQQIGPFTPRTLGLHPTQVYETISMFLLIFFLLSFYPYRAYDGQIFTLFVAIYAIHRFLNESLRNDTDIVGIPALDMTLSQNVSVLMFLFAICLEIGHRKWGTFRNRTAAAT